MTAATKGVPVPDLDPSDKTELLALLEQLEWSAMYDRYSGGGRCCYFCGGWPSGRGAGVPGHGSACPLAAALGRSTVPGAGARGPWPELDRLRPAGKKTTPLVDVREVGGMQDLLHETLRTAGGTAHGYMKNFCLVLLEESEKEPGLSEFAYALRRARDTLFGDH